MSRSCQHPHRQNRQNSALKRQEAYNKLSLDEKIAQQEQYKGKQYNKLLRQQEFKSVPVNNSETGKTSLSQQEKDARKKEHKNKVKELNKFSNQE